MIERSLLKSKLMTTLNIKHTYPWGFEQYKLQVELETSAEEGMISQERQRVLEGQQGLVDHGHHVVCEPEYSVIHIQRCELLLVDTHHVLGLGGNQLLLHLPPGHGLQTSVRDLEDIVVEHLDVPELEDVIDDHNESRDPEEYADEDEDLGEERHITEPDPLCHLAYGHLLTFVVLG